MEAKELARHTRSWYGLPVEIVIEGDYWHWVKAGPVPLPHPPLVNLVVRQGLPRDVRLRLSYTHEMGHIQTLPAILVHAFWLLRRRPRWTSQSPLRRLTWLGAFLLVHQAAWELAAEGYVAARHGLEYYRVHRQHGRGVAALFWAGMALVAVVGTLLLASKNREV